MFDKEKENNLLHLNIRIKEGVKEEIIRIIEIPQVGRVRGRRLYNNGFKSIDDIANARVEDISCPFSLSTLTCNIISTCSTCYSIYLHFLLYP